MTTPETPSAELERLPPSLDGSAVEIEDIPLLPAEDVCELSVYSFDSSDQTLVGLGSSESADSNVVRHFDSSDRTLVGIGPAERAERAELARAEVVSDSSYAEPMPESVPTPYSEPPGPFVRADEEVEALPRAPVYKAGPWSLALLAAIGVAAVALVRDGVPHPTAPRLPAAAAPVPDEPRIDSPRFASTLAERPADELPSAQVPEAREPPIAATTAQREKPTEPALRVALKSVSVDPPLGSLDVTSNPPSSLVLDGRPLGKTPRVVQLPSGPHTVVFVHPQRGRVSVTVSVRAGRTTNASADF